MAHLPMVSRQALRALAEDLQEAARKAPLPPLLQGKIVGLVSDSDQERPSLLRQAAEELGARVACIRPGLNELSEPAEIRHTARMLGKLYAALDAPGMEPLLLAQVSGEAGIPVYNGISSASHPVMALVDEIGGGASSGDVKRLRLLQAVLLSTIT